MRLVQNDSRVSLQLGIVHGLSEQHTIRHVLQKGRPILRHVLESNTVTDFLSELHVHLIGHSLRNTHSGDSTRLGTRDHLASLHGEVGIADKLGDLGGLSGSGLTFHDCYLVLREDVEEFSHLLVHRKVLSTREDLFVLGGEGGKAFERVDFTVLYHQ